VALVDDREAPFARGRRRIGLRGSRGGRQCGEHQQQPGGSVCLHDPPAGFGWFGFVEKGSFAATF
jgi:hypothetical protein